MLKINDDAQLVSTKSGNELKLALKLIMLYAFLTNTMCMPHTNINTRKTEKISKADGRKGEQRPEIRFFFVRVCERVSEGISLVSKKLSTTTL